MSSRVAVLYKGQLGNNLFQFAAGWVLADRLQVPLKAEPLAGFQGTTGFTGPPLRGKPFSAVRPDDMTVDWPGCQAAAARGQEIVLDGYCQRYDWLRGTKARLRELLRPDTGCGREFGDDELVVNIRLGEEYFWPVGASPFSYDLAKLEEVIAAERFSQLHVVTDVRDHQFLQTLRYKFQAVVHHQLPLEDFALLMQARRLIISPSSFGWWAAWLGRADRILFPHKRGIWGVCPGLDLWVDDEPRYAAW